LNALDDAGTNTIEKKVNVMKSESNNKNRLEEEDLEKELNDFLGNENDEDLFNDIEGDNDNDNDNDNDKNDDFDLDINKDDNDFNFDDIDNIDFDKLMDDDNNDNNKRKANDDDDFNLDDLDLGNFNNDADNLDDLDGLNLKDHSEPKRRGGKKRKDEDVPPKQLEMMKGKIKEEKKEFDNEDAEDVNLFENNINADINPALKKARDSGKPMYAIELMNEEPDLE